MADGSRAFNFPPPLRALAEANLDPFGALARRVA